MEVELLIAVVMGAAMLLMSVVQCHEKKKKMEKLMANTEKWKMKGGKEKWTSMTGGVLPPNAVPVMGHPLQLPNGAMTMQFVALLRVHGKAIMGRCWNNQGVVASSFASDGKELSKVPNDFQVLTVDQTMHGHVYKWKQMSKLKALNYQWIPIQVENIAPCVIDDGGVKKLGMADLKTYTAVLAWNGAIVNFAPPVTDNFLVLCQRADVNHNHVEFVTPPDAPRPVSPTCLAPRRHGLRRPIPVQPCPISPIE